MENMLEDYKLEGEILPIITYPNLVLTTKAVDVTEFDDELKLLCKNMLFTMYNAPGIGLAAPQIGLSKRIFVLDVGYSREETEEDSDEYFLGDFDPMIIINPIFVKQEGEILYEEGCLSLPGVYEEVKRYESISIEYQDVNGDKKTLDAVELLSICIQHENDHLDGIVFIERLSSLKKTFIKKRLMKAKKKV